MPLPLVAIVGAPNVGKSTLFNRLVGGRRAIVTDQPGVTRDRLYGEVTDVKAPFSLVDTGGLVPMSDAPFAREIEKQAEQALREAAVILFVVDARAGLTPLDQELSAMLHRRHTPLVLVANKVDGEKQSDLIHDLYGLGFGAAIPVSAEHSRGIDGLLGKIGSLLSELPSEGTDWRPNETDTAVRVAIVGKPNVGKSSLLNKLLGEERAIVSAIPGTTRDATDTYLTWEKKPVLLIDTAGIRRRGRIEQGIEKYSVLRAMRSIGRADVVMLLLDAEDLVTAQDAHVAGYVLEEMRSIIVVVNKWDLITKDTYTMDAYTKQVRALQPVRSIRYDVIPASW